MVLYLLTGYNKWTKFHSLLLLDLTTLGIKKVDMDMCVFTSQYLVLNFIFVPSNYAFFSVEYNQILSSSFREQGGLLHILIKTLRR